MWFYFFISSVIVLLDLSTKAIVLSYLKEGQSIAFLPFLNWVFFMNKGVSFSMFTGVGAWLLTLIAVVISAGVCFLMIKEKSRFSKFALALIFGGAIGNIVDRIRFGSVVDFIDFYIGRWHWPAFNIADSAICIGVALLLFQMVFLKEKRE